MPVLLEDDMEKDTNNRLPIALFLLRVSIFIVMFMWTLDKFIHFEHASAVYANFYFISGLGKAGYYVIGAVEMIILAGFLIGYRKKWTYSAVLIFHGISTLSTFRQYLSPFQGPNLLFFAAWPMLAACFALYYLRERDILGVIGYD
jgi:uncharacterized membrane protein YkgB